MRGRDKHYRQHHVFMICSHMGFSAIDATFKLPGQAVSSAKGDPPDHSAMHYNSHQGSYFAHRITLEGLGEDALAQSLSTARVDLTPHQVDVALFALSSPLSKNALLAYASGMFEEEIGDPVGTEDRPCQS